MKKKPFWYFLAAVSLICCFIFPQNAFAASGYRIIVQLNDNSDKIISALGDGYYVVQSGDNEKMGVCGEDGKFIIPAAYDRFLEYYENGTVIAVNGRLKGLLDIRGAAAGGSYELLPIKYLDVCYVTDNRYLVRTAEDQWGMVDRKDKLVAGYLPSGYKVEGWDDLYNAMDSKKVMHSLKLANLLRVRGNGKYGLMDTSFNIVIPIEYEYLDILGQNSIVAVQNGKYGLLDALGNTLIPIQYRFITRVNDSAYIIHSNDGYKVYDISSQRVLIPEKYDYLTAATDNLLIAYIDGVYGAIDISGKEIVPFIYDGIWTVDVPDNIFGYLKQPAWADYKTVPEITSYLAEQASSVRHINTNILNSPRSVYKLLHVEKNGKQYLIDPEKRIPTPSEGFDQIVEWCGYGGGYVINKDGIIVKNGDMYGLIDLRGRVLIPFLYSTMEIPYDIPNNFTDINYIFVYRNGDYAVLNRDNQAVTPFKEYPEAHNHASKSDYLISSENGLLKELMIGTTSGIDYLDGTRMGFDPYIPDVSNVQSFGNQPFDAKDGLLYLVDYKEKPALVSFNWDVPQWTGLELAAGSADYYKYGVKHTASSKPYISDTNRMMIPLSAASEMFDVIVTSYENLTIISKVNASLTLSDDGKPPYNKAEVSKRDGELYTSLRDLADFFGYTVLWEPDGQKVKVYIW